MKKLLPVLFYLGTVFMVIGAGVLGTQLAACSWFKSSVAPAVANAADHCAGKDVQQTVKEDGGLTIVADIAKSVFSGGGGLAALGDRLIADFKGDVELVVCGETLVDQILGVFASSMAATAPESPLAAGQRALRADLARRTAPPAPPAH